MRVSSPRTRDKDNFVIYVTDVSILKPRVTWFLETIFSVVSYTQNTHRKEKKRKKDHVVNMADSHVFC